MARHDVNGVVLSARWASDSGFTFGLSIPTDITIGFNQGITTTPIDIMIYTNPVRLRISAGLKVPVPYQDPLYFSFYLDAGITDAEFTATMDNYWQNPFGLGQNIKIGDVAVGVKINYAQFAVSGTPR